MTHPNKPIGWRIIGRYKTILGNNKFTDSYCVATKYKWSAINAFVASQPKFVRATLSVLVFEYGTIAHLDRLLIPKVTDHAKPQVSISGISWPTHQELLQVSISDISWPTHQELLQDAADLAWYAAAVHADIHGGLKGYQRRAAKAIAFGNLYGGSFSNGGVVTPDPRSGRDTADGVYILSNLTEKKMKQTPKVGELFTVGDKSHDAGRTFYDSSYAGTIFIAVAALPTGVYAKPVYGYWKDQFGDEKDIFFETKMFTSLDVMTPSQFRQITGTNVKVSIETPVIKTQRYYVSRGTYGQRAYHNGYDYSRYIVSFHEGSPGRKRNTLISFYNDTAEENLSHFLLDFLKDKEVTNVQNNRHGQPDSFEVVLPS